MPCACPVLHRSFPELGHPLWDRRGTCRLAPSGSSTVAGLAWTPPGSSRWGLQWPRQTSVLGVLVGIWAMGSAAPPRVHPGVSAPHPAGGSQAGLQPRRFFSLPLARGPVTRRLFSPKQVCPGAPRPQLKSDQMGSRTEPSRPQRWGCSRSKQGQESEIPDPTSHSTFGESLFSEFSRHS